MSTTWSFYDAATGLFHGGRIMVPDGVDPAPNTPEGHVAIEGAYDMATQCVDLAATPPTVVDYQPPAPAATDLATWTWDTTSKRWLAVPTLAAVQASQISVLTDAYQAAIARPVPFTTSAGVTQTFQADPESIADVTSSMLGCQAAQATPEGFFWVALDNTHVPFAFVDLQGLAAAIFAQAAPAFATLQTLKTAVRNVTTADAVVAVVWPS